MRRFFLTASIALCFFYQNVSGNNILKQPIYFKASSALTITDSFNPNILSKTTNYPFVDLKIGKSINKNNFVETEFIYQTFSTQEKYSCSNFGIMANIIWAIPIEISKFTTSIGVGIGYGANKILNVNSKENLIYQAFIGLDYRFNAHFSSITELKHIDFRDFKLADKTSRLRSLVLAVGLKFDLN